jgi:hypothetical protein
VNRDPRLHALVAAIQKANATHDLDDIAQAAALGREYIPSAEPLDIDAAIRELHAWATPVSLELRYVLARYLEGGITGKRGRKAGAVSAARMAAARARELYAELHSWEEAIGRAAAEFPVTESAINAVIFPRKRRKST